MPNPSSQNCLLVIFGASGDLTKRKLIPALFTLWQNGNLPERFAVVGIARTDYSDQAYRDELYDFDPKAYGEDRAKWQEFSSRVRYIAADSTQDEAWSEIERSLCQLAQEVGTGDNILFYLSLAPQFFEPVIKNIGRSGLVTEGRRYCSLGADKPWQRIVIEKPFGSDPSSAASLNQTLAEVFDESVIYRIDHYLGKELVQNMLVLRFANSLFEPIWNQQYVDHVQITASETVGVEGRGSYYDSPAGGAMRDMVQSHLLQVLSVIAMEPPVSLDAADIRTEKIKIFKALRVPKADDIPNIAVRGQYGAGQVNGKSVIAYRDEKGVDPESQTDTFAAMNVSVDTWRWGGVPFYLRSGKAMARKQTEIAIYLKPTPHVLFREQARKLKANQILISIQPNEGIRLRFEGKVPGLGLQIKDVVMDFDYVKQWEASPPDGYATLLHDCIRGDQTLFKHRDEIECAWDAVQPVLDYWSENPQDDLPNYNAGTWGPSSADIMMAKDGRYWHNL
ncbi:glucose-6-phosphate dehydrogenase [Mucisphaera sp.]|uniref:glucose-6-phosphate dehydrogenase n=1 Tax=Mucisphaera sp. TaxID=2913024 RepID=UPI003D0CA592